MSLETWKSEHYAVPADKVPESLAIKHSLLKWRGLRLQVLLNHGLQGRQVLREVDDVHLSRRPFYINGNTCALCHHYVYSKGEHLDDEGESCKSCPLFLVRGMPCDKGPDGNSPFSDYSRHGDPEPMIALLEEALKRKESGDGASDCLPR